MKCMKVGAVCMAAAAICGIVHAKPIHKAMEYTSVSIGGAAVSEGLPLVNAIQSH